MAWSRYESPDRWLRDANFQDQFFRAPSCHTEEMSVYLADASPQHDSNYQRAESPPRVAQSVVYTHTQCYRLLGRTENRSQVGRHT